MMVFSGVWAGCRPGWLRSGLGSAAPRAPAPDLQPAGLRWSDFFHGGSEIMKRKLQETGRERCQGPQSWTRNHQVNLSLPFSGHSCLRAPPCFQLRGRDPHPPARGLDTQLIQPWLIPGHTDSAKAPVCPARPPICHLLLPDRSEASLALVESLRAVICILGHRPRQSRLNTHHGFRSHQVPRLGSRPSGWATSGGLECSVDPHCPLPPSPGFFYTPGVWAGFKSEQAVSRENCRGHPAVLSCLIFVSSCRQPTAGFPRVSASELQIFKDALRTICIHVFLSFCQFQDFLNIS